MGKAKTEFGHGVELRDHWISDLQKAQSERSTDRVVYSFFLCCCNITTNVVI